MPTDIGPQDEQDFGRNEVCPGERFPQAGRTAWTQEVFQVQETGCLNNK